MKLFDTTLEKLEASLNVRLQKQNVLASNLANLDTPGYLPKDLNFEKALAAEVSGGRPVAPEVEAGAEPGLDGNGVDLDRTLIGMAENGMLYGAAARAAGKKLSILRVVASENP